MAYQTRQSKSHAISGSKCVRKIPLGSYIQRIRIKEPMCYLCRVLIDMENGISSLITIDTRATIATHDVTWANVHTSQVTKWVIFSSILTLTHKNLWSNHVGIADGGLIRFPVLDPVKHRGLPDY